jgi:hypothetical protein
MVYTVILVRPKTGESAQLSFAPKCVGDFFELSEFCPMSSQKFADLGEIRPNRKKYRPNFFWRNSTACISNKFRPTKIKVWSIAAAPFSSNNRRQRSMTKKVFKLINLHLDQILLNSDAFNYLCFSGHLWLPLMVEKTSNSFFLQMDQKLVLKHHNHHETPKCRIIHEIHLLSLFRYLHLT